MNSEDQKRRSILIVAGEPSADRYGARLIERLRELPGNQSLNFFGTGGDRMERSGVELLRHARDLASIGPHEAIPVLRRYLETYRSLLREAARRRPRVALLLDFPDFNLQLAKKLKRLGVKVIYYISPQLWAWRSRRIRLVRRYVDKMLVILPFEEEYYRSRGVAVEYVGHPLLEDFAPEVDRQRFLERTGSDAGRRIVAILPGSRRKEVHHILPTLIKAGQLVLKHTPVQFLISAGVSVDRSEIRQLTAGSLAGDANARYFQVVSEDARNLLANSDFAMVKSGTSTLEAALIGVPFLIVYRISPVSWHLGWPLIKSRFVGLANLIANEEVVPEFLQEAASPAALAQKTLEYLESPAKCDTMKLRLSEIRERLGKFCASERAAAAVHSFNGRRDPMKKARTLGFLLSLAMTGLFSDVQPQARRAPSAAPKIDVEHYAVRATLNPEAHEIKAITTITFQIVEDTDLAVFDLSENISVQKILDPRGVEILFGQDEIGPGILSVHFAKPLAAGTRYTIQVEHSGGFDRDRYSRLYTRDESSAYIGIEGTYLLYQAKWFPINRFLLDRATAKIEITVPLGMTVVGPGAQLPVVTKGITETFGWEAAQPTLPNSIVAARYLEKSVQSDAVTMNCFAREDHLDSIQTNAKIAAKVISYYEKQFGPSVSGHSYRLVEVDDKLVSQPGMMGTIFITHRELSQSVPAIRDLARRIAYQWWMESVGVRENGDLWLIDGLSYYCAAMYLGASDGDGAFKDEIDNLAVLGLKFEGKSPIRTGLSLGFRSEQYESVVAGKGAWVCHMLRNMIGDAKFSGMLQEYFHSFKGSSGSAADFRKLAEKAYGKELNWFFAEWIDSIGVPNLQVDYMILKTVTGFRVSGTLKQDKDLFRMPIEVEIISQDKPARSVVDLSGKAATFDIATDSMPKAVVVDPDSKIMRDSRELQTSVQLSLGNDLKLKGNFVEAIKAYENALKLNPRKSLAHFRLAEVFWEQFNLQSAANSFRDALNGDKDPKWTEVWAYIYLGKIYDILNQRQRAMAEYNKAINTKDDTFGAQAEAKKWIEAPFTRERTTMDRDAK